MKNLILLAAAAASISACTIEQQNGELRQEFNPPLTYDTWKIERYETQSGRRVCEVTAGGLTIAQSRDGKHTPVAARGERKMTPGMEFSVNVNGNHYRTSQEYFSFTEASRLAENLSMGGKAYLEWSEPHGDNHGRLRTNNIVKLDDFKARFEECRASLGK